MLDRLALVLAARMARPRGALLGAAIERRHFMFVLVLLERFAQGLRLGAVFRLRESVALVFATFLLAMRGARRLGLRLLMG